MKRIEAVIRNDRLPEVKLALANVPKRGLTICDVKEQDTHSGFTLHYRSTSCELDLLPRVSVSLLVDDADAAAAVRAIVGAAQTGHEGDGTVVVVPVDEVVQISGVAAVA